ncbi:MAG TPA: Ig-like domain-containing protein [Acidobacteriaceae bacterium]|jgi:uncharacterized protein YjdB|nr:Ig-like domain-containing protein [Acidobacteriaceae bacterium]
MSKSLTGLIIQPTVGTVIVGTGATEQYHAIGVYTESGHATTTEDITSQVTWSSTVPLVATISATTGLATGVQGGTAVISATAHGGFGPVTATSDITVAGATGGTGGTGTTTRSLTLVTVIPNNQTIAAAGETAQYLAIGTYSAAPTSENLTSLVTWQSSDSSVAQVSSTGLVTGTGIGTATITALATGPDGSVVSGFGTVTVAAAQPTRALTALDVTPGTQDITSTGQTAQLLAIGVYNTSPVTVNMTNQVQWQSSDAQVATVASTGLVTGVGPGSATITALATAPDGSILAATAAIQVSTGSSGRILTSLSVTPTAQTVGEVGETAQFLAIGTYSAAPLTADLTDQVNWISSDTDVATISSSGLATTIGIGTTSITAITTLPDTSVISATGVLTWPPNQVDTGSPTTPTLTVLNLGGGGGTVQGPGNISCTSTAGAASPTSTCTGTFTLNQTVTLIATHDANSVFDGWSSNCTPVTGSPNQCTITLGNNANVAAIFDPQ